MRYKLVAVIIIFGLLSAQCQINGTDQPQFVIFTPGFWGSMDKLPTNDPQWLKDSPYPHYHKHQDISVLAGPDYRPIPQKYLALSEGPSATKLLLCSYRLMLKEFAFWASRVNKQSGKERIKIIDDWQELESKAAPPVGEINLIYLKYDWRLDLPQMSRHYAKPLLELIDRKWPGAKVHWVGHSLGGLFGRYVAAEYPGRLASLISIGGPHYGIYEIGNQRRGERTTFNGIWYIERSQQIGLYLAEKFFLGERIVKTGDDFYVTAAKFANEYTPVTRWLDPKEGLLEDGFGTPARLSEAVPKHAIALYGLGYGSYDLQGEYHPEILSGDKVGPALEPEPTDRQYALSGDGRVDPVSARGPFQKTICLGKDLPHGNLMWSSLVLAMLEDRYFFNGAMPKPELMLSFRRTGVSWEDKELMFNWILKARKVWEE